LGFRVITTKEYCSISSFFLLSQKSNKRLMAGTITRETKKGWPKKGQKTHSPQEPKKMERAIPLVVGSYLTHGPSKLIAAG
jgi:hypothetical protein